MSATIILSARPAKEKLEALLKEVQEMDLTPLEQMLTREETRQQHEARKRIIEERTMRLKLHISTLETINTNWIQYIQQVPATNRKEDKYAQMIEDKRGILNLISEGKEVIITLSMEMPYYDITPENYDVIRKVLIEKFGQSHIIKKSLYNELYTVKKNDREWKVTVEATERILRQLEAMGENLEQSSIEIIIENKLPLDSGQSISTKGGTKNMANMKISKTQRPYAFYNKNHWDNECQTYPSLERRMQRLKENNACLNCLQPGHTTINCKTRKRVCFYCKGHHNTALCYTKYNDPVQSVGLIEDTKTVKVINPVIKHSTRNNREVLLFSKEVEVINLDMPEVSNKIVVLFDNGAQAKCISRKLAKKIIPRRY
uniref:CCHC-type domain-containing protein n=1 Tax=Wuchereria bancrofti TaxID=6293 RepID=A0AAF5Q7D4_WUCBA